MPAGWLELLPFIDNIRITTFGVCIPKVSLSDTQSVLRTLFP